MKTPGGRSSIESYASAYVPDTTNKTAGNTPYVNLNKRKLSYQVQQKQMARQPSRNRCVRTVKARAGFVPESVKENQTKLWYSHLPDGWVYAWAAKGENPDGPVGFFGSAPRLIMESLDDASSTTSRFARIASQAKITKVLTLRDESGGPKLLNWGEDFDKVMNVRSFVHVFPSVDNLTPNQSKQWATNLTTLLNRNFKQLKLTLGGNAQDFGIPTPTCIEDVFLTDDVANLALITYEDSIMDFSFFDDTELVGKYFSPTTDARSVFENLGIISSM